MIVEIKIKEDSPIVKHIINDMSLENFKNLLKNDPMSLLKHIEHMEKYLTPEQPEFNQCRKVFSNYH